MATKLEQAVQIFTELGWEKAAMEETPNLAIGTKEQQKTAKEGLKSGEWGEYRKIEKNTYGYVPLVDADLAKLALFAVRVGVDAKRAANILRSFSKETLQILSDRGKKYAADFINSACASGRRAYEHSASVFGEVCVHLVYQMHLEVPQNIEYIKDWSVYAGHAMGLRVERRYGGDSGLGADFDFIRTRFKEHIEAGIAAGAPATGPFSDVFSEGVKRGLLTRDEAVGKAFFALDASVRPGDRKQWINVLRQLQVSDEEVLEREQNVISLLSLGDSFLIEAFAALLIQKGSDALLPDILISCFSCKTKKTRQHILKAALERPVPKCSGALCDWFALLAGDEDAKTAGLAQKIMRKWGLASSPGGEKEASGPQGLWQETPEIWSVPAFDLNSLSHKSPEELKDLYYRGAEAGMGQAGLKPPEQAKKEIVSLDYLSQIVIENARKKTSVHDLASERLLALANIIARIDPKEAKLALAGIKSPDVTLNNMLYLWAKGKASPVSADGYEFIYQGGERKPKRKHYSPLMTARDSLLAQNIGRIPCILSTPSFEDLSISFHDLVNRLYRYVEEGFDFVYEPDLQLALTRLDTKSAAAEDIRRVKEIRLLIKLPDGMNLYRGNELYELDQTDRQCGYDVKEKLDRSKELNKKNAGKHQMLYAGDVIREYLKQPFAEPDDYYEDGTRYWGYQIDLEMPPALKDFPHRLRCGTDELYAVFPLFGDFALTAVRRDDEVYHGQGLIVKQIVKRRLPFEKAASVNLLSLQSNLSEENAQDVAEAAVQAWERGLLRPNVADVKYLDWDPDPPRNLASFADSLDNAAQEGMLSVVWPVINDAVGLSLRQQRMLSGTADLVKLVKKYIPEVLHAVKHGMADQSVLKLEGIRALARKSGSSVAAAAAKEVVGILAKEGFDHCDENDLKKEKKEADAAKQENQSKEEFRIREPELPFEAFWKPYPKQKPILEDGVQMDANLIRIGASKTGLVFDLKLPDTDDRVYKALIYNWVYSLTDEGQIPAVECPAEALKDAKDQEKQLQYLEGDENRVWLYYDGKQKKLAVSPFRNSRGKNHSPLQGGAYPLSVSLLVIALSLVAQDGDSIYPALRLIGQFADSGEMGAAMAKRAMKELLKHEDVSPAKLLRVLEQESRLFSALWPVLTVSVAFAGEETLKRKKPPVWVNRVLDVCLYNAFYLKEAMKTGSIPEEDAGWDGLKEIADCRAKSAAVAKAKALLQYFGK